MMKSSIVRMLMALIFSVLMAIPVFAQDGVDAPTETPVATVVDEAPVVDVTEAPNGDTTVIVQPAKPFDFGSFYGLLAGLFVVFAGGGSILVLINNASKSKQIKDNAEMLFEGLSPTWQETINRVLDFADNATAAAQDTIRFAREVTDGKPNVDVASVETWEPNDPTAPRF